MIRGMKKLWKQLRIYAAERLMRLAMQIIPNGTQEAADYAALMYLYVQRRMKDYP